MNYNSDTFKDFLENIPANSDVLCEFVIGLNENVIEIIFSHHPIWGGSFFAQQSTFRLITSIRTRD